MVEVQFNSFLIPALHGSEQSISRPGRLIPNQEPRYLLNKRLGRSQSRSGCSAGQKNLLHP